MTQEASALYALISEIRRSFQDLAAFGSALHDDLDITAARRALMEQLATKGPDTVANIARAKNVSRQHIQQLADQLVAGGVARFEDNPAHKRSQLVALTELGSTRFATMQPREDQYLERLAGRLDPAEVRAARDTLARLRQGLAEITPTSPTE